MIELKLKGKTLQLYETSKELPIVRTHELNKLSFYDMNVGSTPEDYNKHLSKVVDYLINKNLDEAVEELKNTYRGYYNAINKVGVWSFSFVPYIHSINGKEYDLSGSFDDYKKTLYELSKSGLTNDLCNSTIEDLKKKLLMNWNPIFLAVTVVQDMKISMES